MTNCCVHDLLLLLLLYLTCNYFTYLAADLLLLGNDRAGHVLVHDHLGACLHVLEQARLEPIGQLLDSNLGQKLPISVFPVFLFLLLVFSSLPFLLVILNEQNRNIF